MFCLALVGEHRNILDGAATAIVDNDGIYRQTCRASSSFPSPISKVISPCLATRNVKNNTNELKNGKIFDFHHFLLASERSVCHP
jgi:hypothetical protein